jgi:hypothetical protein
MVSVSQVQIKPIPSLQSGELSEKFFRKCHFCEKNCELVANQLELIDRLSGSGNFYCCFCLRHRLNKKRNRNVLIFSFRSIIAHFYFKNYIQINNGQKLGVSQIEDYIEAHRQIGSVNPLFLYDSETLLWFLDFSRVGHGKKKIIIEEILKTISNILDSFNLSETIPEISRSSVYLKYKQAIEFFDQNKFLPNNQNMFIPIITSDFLENKSAIQNKMRNFVFDDLKIKKQKKRY